ncbi:hypothetical protein [Mucilaginibacter aurantiaciroseus]|nr:hypothetical protein [Mucilaginibacter aurantiaciroseus]
MSEYLLERPACKTQTAKEAADHDKYYKELPLKEKLSIVNY